MATGWLRSSEGTCLSFGLRLCCLLLSALMVAKCAAIAQEASTTTEFQFDIPAQPLASSLKAYSAVTNLELYYESNMVDGYRSPSIRGSLSPDTALRRLLEGTGFSIASFEPGTMTILPPRQPAKGRDLAEIKSKAAEFTPYFALIQAGLRAIFCQTPAVQTDTAELIVRLWISPSGAVARANILSTTGSGEHHLAYVAALRKLVIDQAPPKGMPQPVTLMVLPRTSPTAAECSQFGSSDSVRALAHE